jgi:hypothetical protein
MKKKIRRTVRKLRRGIKIQRKKKGEIKKI